MLDAEDFILVHPATDQSFTESGIVKSIGIGIRQHLQEAVGEFPNASVIHDWLSTREVDQSDCNNDEDDDSISSEVSVAENEVRLRVSWGVCNFNPVKRNPNLNPPSPYIFCNDISIKIQL